MCSAALLTQLLQHATRTEPDTYRYHECTLNVVAALLQVRVAYDIFMLSGVLEELAIPESELTGFLSAVSAHYHNPEDVPYHNLSHVVQVLHAVWLVSMATGT